MSASLRICAASPSEMSFVALVSCVGLGQRRGCVAYVAFGQIVSNVPVVSCYGTFDGYVRALVGGLVWCQRGVCGFLLDGLPHVWNGLHKAPMGCWCPFTSKVKNLWLPEFMHHLST